MSKPVIGITLDWQAEGSFSSYPHYALRAHYFDAIAKAGGLPFGIPYIHDSIAGYVDKCDGFLTPGGGCASPLEWYVDEEQKTGSPYDPSPRVSFELELTKAFLDADKPVLGICMGMQQLGAMHGCRMTGDVHTYLDTDIVHALAGRSPEEYTHSISIVEDTLLSMVIKNKNLLVNTAHKEAIVKVGNEVKVSALSDDGCIKAIELMDYKFALGVQWHPEYFIDAEEEGHLNVFKALIQAC